MKEYIVMGLCFAAGFLCGGVYLAWNQLPCPGQLQTGDVYQAWPACPPGQTCLRPGFTRFRLSTELGRNVSPGHSLVCAPDSLCGLAADPFCNGEPWAARPRATPHCLEESAADATPHVTDPVPGHGDMPRGVIKKWGLWRFSDSMDRMSCGQWDNDHWITWKARSDGDCYEADAPP